jgi:transcription elongation factor GreA
VAIGSRVVLEHEGDEISYTIVSPTEASPGNGRISFASPVGRALMGHAAGAEVTIGTPSGEARYRIVEVG